MSATIWAEVEAGQVGLIVNSGKFFLLNETDITKVHHIDDDNVYVIGGAVVFKASQVKLIQAVKEATK